MQALKTLVRSICSPTARGRQTAILIGILAALASGHSRAQTADQTVQAGDIRITVRGEGTPVLFIPGLNSGAATWDDTCAALQPGVQCLIAQLPGFAGAPKSETYRAGVVPSARDQLNGYLKQRFPQGVAVVGHSLGGVIALSMAMQDGAPVKRLVIVDSLPFLAAVQNPAMTVEQSRPRAEATREAVGKGQMSPEALAAQLKAMAAGMVQDAPHQATLVDWGLASDRATTGQAMYDMGVTDLRPELAHVHVPTTVLGSWAAYKPYGSTMASTRSIFELQYQQLKGVTIRMSEAGYHFLMWDDAALVTQAVREAL